MPDKHFTKISEIAEGDTLIADDGFECILPGAELVVLSGMDGLLGKEGLFVRCAQGKHFLSGQKYGKHYIGFTKK